MLGRSRRLALVALSIAALLAGVGGPAMARAQVADGATLTVLRGEVAALRPDGSAVQPAPSGTTVYAGDEIRTLGATGALITFFVGTEIELGPDTVLVVDRIARRGEQVEISLKQAFGSTVSRVQALTAPGSAYRIEAGGAVAVVRGSTLAVRGPETTPTGTFVSMVCEDCGPESYVVDLADGERAPLGPQTFGYTWGVGGRGGAPPQKAGGFEPFRVERQLGLHNALAGGITLAEHRAHVEQRGGPPGRHPLGGLRDRGGRDGRGLQRDRRDREERPQIPAERLLAGELTCGTLAGGGAACALAARVVPGAVLRLRVPTLGASGPGAEGPFVCGPAPGDGLLTCAFTVAGRVFQGTPAGVLEVLPSGEAREAVVILRCAGGATRPGDPC